MRFLINEKKQTQCPECGQWIDMVHNEKINQYEIEHCRRKWCLFITKEGLENPEKVEAEKKKKRVRKKKEKMKPVCGNCKYFDVYESSAYGDIGICKEEYSELHNIVISSERHDCRHFEPK